MARSKGGVVLEDGPAAGRYSVRRAPYFLRAVVGRTGHRDLLDQLHDMPMEGEAVHVYEAVPGTIVDWSQRHDIIVCPTPGASGQYRHRPDIDGEPLRTTEAWRSWARSQPTAEPVVDGVTGKPRAEAPG